MTRSLIFAASFAAVTLISVVPGTASAETIGGGLTSTTTSTVTTQESIGGGLSASDLLTLLGVMVSSGGTVI